MLAEIGELAGHKKGEGERSGSISAPKKKGAFGGRKGEVW